MNKNEFLAMSLPYGLKIAVIDNENLLNRIIKLNSSNYNSCCEMNYYNPVLYPLSSLTKEIEHIKNDLSINTESENYNYLGVINYAHAFSLDGMKVGIMAMPFFFIQKLIEKHFDVCSLIEKGEAIDVNTLTENPYK